MMKTVIHKMGDVHVNARGPDAYWIQFPICPDEATNPDKDDSAEFVVTRECLEKLVVAFEAIK